MRNLFLNRLSDDGKQTLGLFTLNFDGISLSFKTLELPWLDNQSNVSCIPVGEYDCTLSQSSRLSKIQGKPVVTYEIKNVENRTGIRIHSANHFNQLLGCIALGMDFSDMNEDGEADLVSSKKAIQQFEEIMNGEDFKLIITNQYEKTTPII